jgi:ketosteroid isomerase-like protein
MSQDNVEIVRRLIEDNQSTDPEARTERMLAVLDPAFEYTSVTVGVDTETFRGHDGVRRYQEHLLETWKEWRTEITELRLVTDDTVFRRLPLPCARQGHRRGDRHGARLGLRAVGWKGPPWPHVLDPGRGARRHRAVTGYSGPMSQTNVELARRFYDAVNQRDLDAWLAVTHEDAELISILAAVEGGYHGHDGFRRWWEHVFKTFPDYRIAVEEVRDLGDVTLAAITLQGHGLGSGAPIAQRLSQVIEWRDDKAARVQSFATEAEALRGAGLQ